MARSLHRQGPSSLIRLLDFEAINPVGTMILWAGSKSGASVPAGWLVCDGSAVSRSTYADLFAAIGTTYGAGDGSTTFNLPTATTGHVPTGITLTANTRGTTVVSDVQSASHTHNGTSGVQSASHTHNGTSGSESGHTHNISGTSGNQSANHTHDFVVNPGETSNTDTKNTGGQSASHSHLMTVNATGGASVAHTHDTTNGVQSANHTHNTTFGNQSANHTHTLGAASFCYLIKI